jgi:hypothetical protein
MSIYSSQKGIPYVYKCTEKSTGRFYIGYRYKYYDKPEDDLGKNYFTSNEYVKENFSKFDYEIIATFANKRDALNFEGQLIRETQSDLQINYDRIKKRKGT